MTDFTPGPWEIEKRETPIPPVSDGIAETSLDGTWWVRTPRKPNGGIAVALANSEETARLIAASPDLLAAWEEFIAHMSCVFDAQMRGDLSVIPTNAINDILDRAKAAVAKANGVAEWANGPVKR